MYRISKILIVGLFVTVAAAQSPISPLSDTRIRVSTLLREDMFAGFMADDMESFARGEKNLQTLFKTRPEAKPELLTWKASAATYRAVRAYEANRNDEFQQKYKEALDLFAQARQAGPDHIGVIAATGGTYLLFGDRLPKEYRDAAWSTAYDRYQELWKMQAAEVDKLPIHMKGELLAGLATTAMRTGRTEEAIRHLDVILETLPGTPYAAVAKKWKENPKAAADTSMSCMTCHEQGRLAARVNELNNNK
jgi:tetratricopeptide (TPR) repeat protein